MSENSVNKNVKDDEIDLLDLFTRMGRTFNRWFRASGRAILIAMVFLLRRWIPLGLSIILGVGASYYLKYTSAPSFVSDMVIRNNTVANSDMISYINRLHNFCAEKNTSALSDALKLSQESISNISDISAFWVIDKSKDGIPDFVDYSDNHDVYDTINVRMQDRLDIRVRIKSFHELATLRNGIITFINADSLFQQRNMVRLRQNHELLDRLNIDILQLDSLQKVKYFEETRNLKPQSGGQMIFLQEQKTQLVYSDIYSLYSRKQALESERDLFKGIVTVLSDFTFATVRVNGGWYYGKKIIPRFFCVTLVVLILLANWKKLVEVYKKY
jgi:hypothetical protein